VPRDPRGFGRSAGGSGLAKPDGSQMSRKVVGRVENFTLIITTIAHSTRIMTTIAGSTRFGWYTDKSRSETCL
jgi:hypothetical protein